MSAPIDPLLQQRLARLNGERSGTALPPPKVAAPLPRPASNKPGRRVKPARTSKLSALAISATTTLGLTWAFAHQDGQTQASGLLTIATTPVATIATAATTTTPATAAATAAATTSTGVPPSTTVAGIADGTYVGNSDRNRWGTVQVQVVYSGGQLTDVQILKYPNGDSNSVRISQIALPRLVSEAVSARSAEVNTVSGASYTSKSYRLSLQSAIDAARSASGITG